MFKHFHGYFFFFLIFIHALDIRAQGSGMRSRENWEPTWEWILL